MTDCPCDDPQQRVLRIPAGLPALPRQTQAFPEVRIALLAEVAKKVALDGWRARGDRDFGVMWLEMWAYVADVLGFYDERVANESYLRTAVRRSSLRRIVDLLGYVPAPGVAGSATIAAIAEGRIPVPIPEHTAFRSEAFANQAPQVFEAGSDASIHVLTNSWEIGPVAVTALAGGEQRRELTFEASNLGLAKDRFVLLRIPSQEPTIAPQVTRVTRVQPFEGKDGRTYVRVGIDPSVTIPVGTEPTDILVQTPTVAAVITRNALPNSPPGTFPISQDGLLAYLDAIYRQLKVNDYVIVATSELPTLQALVASVVEEVLVTITGTTTTLPITRIEFESKIDDPTLRPATFSFHFSFVDAGRLTSVAETEPAADSLTDPIHPDGVLVTGIVERPPTANEAGVLEQKFLLRDADAQGASVTGRMKFNDDGTARFRITGTEPIPTKFKTPITVFGNVLEVTRGESVLDEILGNGDPRQLHQAFKLKKKPLTYVFDESVKGTHARSTLEVTVDAVQWHEVPSFFGRGPEERVFIVRPNDQDDTFVIFGDGVRGARPPSGVKNIRASYRFGSGEAAPPAGAIKQLAKAVKGLRRVESPIAAIGGKDPDPPEMLRTSAPKSALLFGRAVSALDFEALVNLLPGVVTATAEFLWIPEQQEAGVVVTYIGTASETTVLSAMREESEPNLPLDARKAQAIRTEFIAEVEVHPDFDPAVVAAAVKAALLEEDDGVLSKRRAPIGGRLFRSVILDAMHEVPGVASVTSAIVHVAFSRGAGDFKNSDVIGTCTGADQYLDFAPDDVRVTGRAATAPVLDAEVAP